MNKDKIKKETEKLEEEIGEQIVEKEKDTKKMLIMVAIILGIFILAFVSFRLFYPRDKVVTIDDLHRQNIEGNPSGDNYMYNGYSFVYANGMWYTQVQREDKLWDIPLHFSPKDLENISLTGNLDEIFDEADMYITFNPLGENLQYDALASAELSLNMVKGLGVVPIAACDRNKADNEFDQIEIDKACKERPIVTCDDKDKAVVYLRQEEPAQIEMNENCIILRGNEWDLVRAADRFILVWYGIMAP
ncbi:hypothetical protein KY317_01115 [Candidatus Woesearchaeota archaeon]|nr:hypothetical protein [Candidatus Woesearchaeota archaeon]